MKYLTPGPVHLPEAVIQATARQPHFHRTEEFKKVLRDVVDKLSKVAYGTPIIAPGTGTFAVDMMVYNYVNPNENVVVPVYGEFGERLAESIESRGANVYKIRWSIGDVPPPDEVEDLCRKIRNVKAIAVVHNETSTGVTNRYIEKMQSIADSVGAVLLIDSVSALPAEPIRSKVDVIATASQKAFLAIPGAAILFISREPRSNYPIPPSMNLHKYLKMLPRSETPYTPPVNVIYGLSASLDHILSIGVERYHEMHRERAEILYRDIKLEPVPKKHYIRSYTVTAFHTDKSKEIISELRRYGYVIAGGMGEIRDRSIRIGVMGDITADDLNKVVEVVNRVVDR
ncbi:MAG: aminotransferase class V-fold PLP-dependent enzyme [Ignisphaera sp.]|nr:aminotransferase class V-fold PLP-dependent enzyme [Ignisphaera sp.]MCX8167613.1 aminotransferase class V-fold PLP-dependent enzyme [Ignisphaera sp.]MDW8086130.1 aminotransferase class V-fold PLP-dependent enzyme [Ignisphaera sp.]